MKGTDVVTKLKKMDISRVALCFNPADQDAQIVLVKSEDGEPEKTPDEAVEAEKAALIKTQETLNNFALPGLIFKTNKRLSDVQLKQLQEKLATQYELFKSDGTPMILDDGLEIVSGIEKSPVLANTDNTAMAPAADDGGKYAVQNCIKSLVKQCNDSKVVPKSIKKNVAEVAKYHGVEGPNTDDDGSAEAFAEITAQLRAVVDILKGLAVSAAKPAMVAPAAPEAPAAKPAAAKPKPAPAKKSVDDERLLSLEKQFDKTRFLLLQALGRDPTPPGE